MFPENFYSTLNEHNLLFFRERNRQNALNLQGMVNFLQDRCSNSDRSYIGKEIQSKLDHG